MSENMEIIKLNLRGTKFETHSCTLQKEIMDLFLKEIKFFRYYPIKMKTLAEGV